jgi:hypothetical protein
MPSINYAEKVEQFGQIVAFCDQEIVGQLGRKSNPGLTSREEALINKIHQKFDAVNALNEEGVKEVLSEAESSRKSKRRNAISGASVVVETDLPDGYKDGSTASESKNGYTSETIYRVLDEEVRKLKSDAVVFSNMLWTDVSEGDKFSPKDIFEEELAKAKKLEEGKAMLVPVVSKGHCVAGMFRKKNGKLQFVYNDPEGRPMSSNGVLQGWFDENREDVEVVDLQIHQQSDNHNCSVYSISNLLKMAANKDAETEDLREKLAEKVDPKKLRARHAEILEGDKMDREGTLSLLDDLRERAICGKMKNLYSQFEQEGRISDGKMLCDNDDEAKELAESIKKSYEEIGVKPCGIEKRGNDWVVRLPEKCRGKTDPFKMSKEELGELKKELGEKPPQQIKPEGISSVFDFAREGARSN